MATSFDKLIADLEAAQSKAQEATAKRYDQMMAIYDEVVRRYQPGGAFEKAALGQLGEQKVQDIGTETQDLVNSGLFGTTTKAGLGQKWESQVGAPARLKLEDIQAQRLSQAQMGKAGAIERVEDVGPDYGLIAGLASQAGQTPTSRSINYPSKSSGGSSEGGYTAQPAAPYVSGTKDPNKIKADYAAKYADTQDASQPSGGGASGAVMSFEDWRASGGGKGLWSSGNVSSAYNAYKKTAEKTAGTTAGYKAGSGTYSRTPSGVTAGYRAGSGTYKY